MNQPFIQVGDSQEMCPVFVNNGSSSRASLRRLRTELAAPRPVEYLLLEKIADADFTGCESPNWGNSLDLFGKECYFRKLCETYGKAAEMARQQGQLEDAIRLYEKEALVWTKKLKLFSAGADRLLEAWKLAEKLDLPSKVNELQGQLYALADQAVDEQRAMKERIERLDGKPYPYANFQIAMALYHKAYFSTVLNPCFTGDHYLEVKLFCAENNVSFENVVKCMNPSMDSEEDESFDDLPNVFALLDAAALLEINGFTYEAARVYERAGNACLAYAEQGICVGQMNPFLIAGLCFEKSPETEAEARNAFQKAKDMWSPDAIEHMITFSDTDEWTTEQKKALNLIYASPSYLELSLACLKLDDVDGFADILCHQLETLSEILPHISSDFDSKLPAIFSGYHRALVTTAEILLGEHSPSYLRIKEAAGPIAFLEESKDYDLILKNLEAVFLSIYAAPKGCSVEELVSMLESDQRLLRP
jgi:hypothetical protein